MDTSTAALIVIAIFAIILIVAFLRYRKSGEAEIRGPFGTALKVKGSNHAGVKKLPGIKAEGITSREGGVRAEDSTGSGLDIRNVDARDDVLLSSGTSHQGDSPKGPPPA
jgi:hypothetical protein